MLDISKKNFEQLGGDLNQVNLGEERVKTVDSPDEVDAKKVRIFVYVFGGFFSRICA